METQERASHPWFGVGMLALGLGLAINTLLGPLFANVIRYPFSETVFNETLGLEAVTLLLVAPLAIISGWLAFHGHPAAGVLAMGPAGYAAYMLVQYALGPQYLEYQPAMLLHIGLFVLSGTLLISAWRSIDVSCLPVRSRIWAVLPFFLAAFALSRWAAAFSGFMAADPLPAASQDATMYWSILFLDLGIVIPLTLAVGIGLLLRRTWAAKALYGVVGWFALVPPSVAAMSMVKIVRDDPGAVPGDALVLVVVAIVFALLALWLYRPLFERGAGSQDEPPGAASPLGEGYAATH